MTPQGQTAARAPQVDEIDRVRAGLELLANPPAVEVGTTPCDIVYEEDRVRLLHYRPVTTTPMRPPLLIVYALINKPYILDLQPDRSVVRALLTHGVDVYLIDWGTPSPADRHRGLRDYAEGYIDRCVGVIQGRAGVDQVSLLGYCIGGFLATIYAALRPEKVRNLIVMAAPLDFHADGGLLHRWTGPEHFDPDLVVEAYGNVPAEFLNGGFTMLDPLGNTYLKYLGLLDHADDEAFVEMFFRMEKWLGDGVPVAGEFYREFIRDGYQRNLLIQNQLTVGGERVDLSRLTQPLLAVVAEKDHIVPPECTRNLLGHVTSTDVEVLSFPVGHIGLSVGAESHRSLWPKVAHWIAARAIPPERKARVRGSGR